MLIGCLTEVDYDRLIGFAKDIAPTRPAGLFRHTGSRFRSGLGVRPKAHGDRLGLTRSGGEVR